MVRRAAIAGMCVVALGCGRISTQVGAEVLEDAQVDATVDAQSDAQLDAGCTPTSLYVDMPSGTLSGGFTLLKDMDAGEYLSPPAGVESVLVPGDASAEYTFPIDCGGTYLVWGRIHGPGALNNTFWVSVDGEPFYQWRLSTGVIFYWHPFTRDTDYFNPVLYAFDAGSHRLTLRNSASDVGLQRVFVAVRGDTPPGNDTPCDPPNSIQLADGGCEVSCGSHGNTICGSIACAGQPPLVAYDCDVCCHPGDAGPDAGPDAGRDAGRDARAEAGATDSAAD
jgi:hypothetical protein